MMRSILAILAGILAAFALMFGMQWLGLALFPLPAGTVLDNQVDLARLVTQSSLMQKLWVTLGWMLASFIGAWIAARLAPGHRRVTALMVAVVITLGVLLNVSALPHPWWMIVAGLLLPLPLAWWAASLHGRPSAKP